MSTIKLNALGLNAIGKPYGANYDPNYRLKHKPTYGHLRVQYPTTMRFVGDHPNYDSNLRCFRGDQWWTQLQTQARQREEKHQTERRKQQPGSEESAAATTALEWKENARKAEFTAPAPPSIGGCYILSPFLHCWTVDYRAKRGKDRTRRQVGFAHTLGEAKAIAQADSEGAVP